MKSRRNKFGLSLIEVMVAMAILASGLFALIAAASRCMSVARQAKIYETARHLLSVFEAENPLALEEEIKDGTDSGNFDGEFSNYSWERTIKLIGEEKEAQEDGLFMVTVRIYWSENGKQSFEEVVTYLHAPDQVEGGAP